MNKFTIILAAMAAILIVASCGKKAPSTPPAVTTAPSPGLDDKRIAVVYFSHHGETYTPDGIVTPEKGNTEVMAEKIVEFLAKGDLLRLETVTPYPTDYQKCCDVAKAELNNKARPELKDLPERLDDYDVIFIGYPIWWGTYPMAVATFIDKMSQSLNGKIIIPFSTNEGSDWGDSLDDLRSALPGSEFRIGLALRGTKVATADNEIRQWLDKLQAGK